MFSSSLSYQATGEDVAPFMAILTREQHTKGCAPTRIGKPHAHIHGCLYSKSRRPLAGTNVAVPRWFCIHRIYINALAPFPSMNPARQSGGPSIRTDSGNIVINSGEQDTQFIRYRRRESQAPFTGSL